MSMLFAAQSPWTAAQEIPETRHRLEAESIPARRPRKTQVWSTIFAAVLLLLASMSVATWPGVFGGTSTPAQPPKWVYVLTVQDTAPKVYGPFSDQTACDLSLAAAMADLNQRLPGLYVATPCSPMRS